MRFADLPRVTVPETPADRVRGMLDRVAIEEAQLQARLAAEGHAADEIERRVRAWYQERPGAEFGDADGEPIAWPRR